MNKAFRTAVMALTALTTVAAGPAQAKPQVRHGLPTLPVGVQRPTGDVQLSIGQGELINLPAPIADVWTSNDAVADVYVSSPRQLHLFGKAAGEATVFAKTAGGQVVFATNVRVGQNLTSVDQMLRLAMSDSDLRVVTAGQLAVITGTVANPDDASQAELLVKGYLNPGINVNDPATPLKMGVISRVKVATPLQVNLQVRIAEVSRDLSKSIGVNLLSGGLSYSRSSLLINQGRDAVTITPGKPAVPADPGPPATPAVPGVPTTFTSSGRGVGTTLSFITRLFGWDFAAALDLAEADGYVTTLANPNLTALSGETASFLAGGEIPIPQSQGLGAVSVQFKQYGVSLAFTPTVLADGRISLRVRPEVSQLSSNGSVRLNGFDIPALTTRRAETTVELGSGQAFMIAGLLSNTSSNSIDKAPFLGDLPILGALFRSQSFRRSQTELMIIVTPYLVKPIAASRVASPTDGYRAPNDAQRILLGQTAGGRSGETRPLPTTAPPTTVRADSGRIAPGFSQ